MANIGGWILIGIGLTISIALIGLGVWGAWFWTRELLGRDEPEDPGTPDR